MIVQAAAYDSRDKIEALDRNVFLPFLEAARTVLGTANHAIRDVSDQVNDAMIRRINDRSDTLNGDAEIPGWAHLVRPAAV